MKVVKMEEWRAYFTSEIQTRYGVAQPDARKSAQELLVSLFGDLTLDDRGDGKQTRKSTLAVVHSDVH